MRRYAVLIGGLISSLLGGPAAHGAADAGRVLVILPERIELEWYWYHYTAEAQHLVQSAVEKALVGAQFDVVDLGAADGLGGNYDIEQLLTQQTALEAAKAAGAAYLIHGKAVAVRAGSGTAYGVAVHRSQADISAKLIRVADGKILAVEELAESGGGESQQAAARRALRSGGQKVAGRLARALGKHAKAQ